MRKFERILRNAGYEVLSANSGPHALVVARGHELLDLARKLKTLTRGKALLVVNDRVDVAISAEADGAQIPEAGLPTLVARGMIGKYGVLGRSIHSVETAVQAGVAAGERIASTAKERVTTVA